MTTTDQDVRRQVIETLDGHEDEYDVDGIVRDIVADYGPIDVDQLEASDYWTLVQNRRLTP